MKLQQRRWLTCSQMIQSIAPGVIRP